MSSPLITFCVPAFNADKRIQRCLDSVLIQGIASEESEILVVDNCSTDRTFSMAQERLQGVRNAQIHRNESNIGRVENWNRCLQLARGRYIKFVMASDILLADSVREKLQIFEESTQLGMVCSSGAGFTGQNPLPRFPKPEKRSVLSPVETLQFFYEQGDRTTGLNGILFNGDLIRELGLLFDTRYPFCADSLLAIHLAARSPVCFVGGPSYLFDAGNLNRYYFVGLSNAEKYFLEHAACARTIRDYLVGYKSYSNNSNMFLFSHYYLKLLDENRPIGVLVTVRTFYPSLRLIARALVARLHRFLLWRAPQVLWMYRSARNLVRGFRFQLDKLFWAEH